VIVLMAFEILQNDFNKTFTKINTFWLRDSYRGIVFRWAIYFALITVVIVFNKDVQQFIYFKF